MGHNVEHGYHYKPYGPEAPFEEIFLFPYHRFGARLKIMLMSKEGHVFAEDVFNNLGEAALKWGCLRYADNPQMHDKICDIYGKGYRITFVPLELAFSHTALQDALQRKAAAGVTQVADAVENVLAAAPVDPGMHPEPIMRFAYKNYRGEWSDRSVLPKKLWFGSSEYHEGEQWFLHGIDVEKGQGRDFALVDMHVGRSYFDLLDIDANVRVVADTLKNVRVDTMDQNERGWRDLLGNLPGMVHRWFGTKE